jgi:hypothetical protein
MNDEILLSDSLKDVLDYNSLYDVQNNEALSLKIWNDDDNFSLNSIKKIKLKKPNMIIDEFTFTVPVNVVNFMLTNNYKIELKFNNKIIFKENSSEISEIEFNILETNEWQLNIVH